jgi:periplasmic nitrate reductase NapD
MSRSNPPSRRELLKGSLDPGRVHISSAVVFARPEHVEAVLLRLDREKGVEVHGWRGSKIVVVLEAANAGELGEMLTRLTLMDGVISAAMIFEQLLVEEAEA